MPDIKTWPIQSLHRQRSLFYWKYASCHGVAASVIAWKKTYSNLNKSTVRGFKKRYEAKLKETRHKNVSPKKKLANNMPGCATLLVQKLDTCAKVPKSY